MTLLLLSACQDPDPGRPPAAPSAGTVTLSPADPRTDDVVTATVTGSSGGLAYSWSVDGFAVGGVGPSLDGAVFAKGQRVAVTVTASRGAATATASAEVTVSNTPPTAPTLAVSEAEDGYQCTVDVASVDADGDGVAMEFGWTTTDSAVGGAELSVAESARGSTWTCTGTPDDGEDSGPPGTATLSLSGPAPGGYYFTKVMDLSMAADLVPLANGTMLVASLMGNVLHVDPSAQETLGDITLYDPDDLISLALDPRFGDGTHDWLYTWTNHTCVLARHDLTLEPLSLTNTIELATMECPLRGGHAGGDLLWWSGETDHPILYLGIGPTTGGNAQEQVEPGQKLLAFEVGDDGTVTPGLPSEFENPYIAARGLRNPWRLADCGAGICIADAGSEYYEEVDLYTGLGMNFGSPVVEGPTDDGRYADPVLYWGDADETNALADHDGPGRSGFMNTPTIGVRASAAGYSGRLEGVLLYADVFDGWVRGAAIDEKGVVGADVAIAYLPFVLAMTEGFDGTIWAVSLDKGLMRLDLRADRDRVGDEGEALSDASPAGVAFEVRYPLWSNGADKERHIEIPTGTFIDTTDPDSWIFPDGTRLWKTFSIDGLPVETRLLEKRAGGWIGGVYVWEGDDAYLTDGTRQDVVLPNGDTYQVPSQFSCITCHDAAEGHDAPLGVNPFQLGDDGLAVLASVLDRAPEPAPDVDIADPLEAEIRGFLAGNCGYCHQPDGPVAKVSTVALDFRYDAQETGLLTEHAEAWNANPWETDGLLLVEPGDPDNSALVGILEAMDMPPVAVTAPDEEHIAAIRAWIAAME